MDTTNSQQTLITPGMGMTGIGSLHVPQISGRVEIIVGTNQQLIPPSLTYHNNDFASQNKGNLEKLTTIQN